MNTPFKIHMENRTDPGKTFHVEVPALWVTESLAIHPEVAVTLDEGRTVLQEDFVVSHAPTGLQMAVSPYLESAVQAAKAFAALPVNWASLTKADVKGLPDEVQGAIKVIRGAASVGGDIFPGEPAGADVGANDQVQP